MGVGCYGWGNGSRGVGPLMRRGVSAMSDISLEQYAQAYHRALTAECDLRVVLALVDRAQAEPGNTYLTTAVLERVAAIAGVYRVTKDNQ